MGPFSKFSEDPGRLVPRPGRFFATSTGTNLNKHKYVTPCMYALTESFTLTAMYVMTVDSLTDDRQRQGA
ncbi:hypothetical protein PGT21_019803 [Puccinia graminis f. sp. tritici]|uniref:Uncharacterized protein n=1 Tax=Puccinia graminis f. sp. tritici TaxID=56615 RepID=A0A5B0NJL5_PUCGR|nr:hypothetical protein PGT21_019803 [Puccinia graminis f. sp. tritici]